MLTISNTPSGVGTLPKVVVVSHERSGTHFLMNSLERAFGYQNRPFVDFDQGTFSLNYFHPLRVAEFFVKLREHGTLPLVKSHHPFGFFSEVIEYVLQDFTILYIYRDPRDVMRSYRRLLLSLQWFEGPKVATDKEFVRTQPCGRMMRYQFQQHANLLQRWASHVAGWTEAASRDPRILPVRYEDLVTDYAATIESLGRVLGIRVRDLNPPKRGVNVIQTLATDHPAYEGGGFDTQDEDFIRDQVGDLLKRLGY